MIFDTLQYTKKLTTAGVPTLQAEAQAEAIKEFVVDGLATKQDLAIIRQDLVNLNNDFKNALNQQELRIIIKLGGIVISSMSLLLIFTKLFRL